VIRCSICIQAGHRQCLIATYPLNTRLCTWYLLCGRSSG
jgi:hypothetical protein